MSRLPLASLVGLFSAVVGFALLLLGLHLYQDHTALHLLDQVLGYNLQQGKLILPPQPPPTLSPPPKQP